MIQGDVITRMDRAKAGHSWNTAFELRHGGVGANIDLSPFFYTETLTETTVHPGWVSQLGSRIRFQFSSTTVAITLSSDYGMKSF